MEETLRHTEAKEELRRIHAALKALDRRIQNRVEELQRQHDDLEPDSKLPQEDQQDLDFLENCYLDTALNELQDALGE
jgi:hypothetical protein